MRRGEIWWADLDEPYGSEPGWRRPMLVVQADHANASRLQTVIAVALTTNLRWAKMPGNVLIPAGICSLPRDSVANVSQIATLDRTLFSECAGLLPQPLMRALDRGLRLMLAL